MKNLVMDKWDEILEFARSEYNISNVSFNTWIKDLYVKKVEDNIVYITSDNSNITSNFNHISTKYGLFLKTAIQEITDSEFDIKFDNNDEDADNDKKSTSSSKVSHTGNEGLPLNPDYTFDNFVVSKNNQLAHATALKAAESPGDIYNPLYIYGDSGLGKTHLMQSIGHFILENDPSKKVMFVTSDIFTNELIDSIRKGDASPAAFREKYRNIDVLLIDDIQFIIGKDRTQEEFFYTFNALYEAKKQIVITSDKPPKDFTTLDERWRSRFGWGIIVDLTPPDYETKVAILQKKIDLKQSEGANIAIDDKVISYMAENINSNIRILEGALTKVIALAKIQRMPATKELAEYALRDMITPNHKKLITPEFIIDVVAEHYGMNPSDILSKKRDKNNALPRQIAMYLSSEYTDCTISKIGSVFGKDHTTVMHNVKKIKQDREKDVSLDETLKVLTNKINPDI
ncbi:MAG: chromosomal replication initiator protein DnaA [Lachnospiraceae bacterium]|nr:chromosomal replication initiator protein DnaA [Lachnospiraceae bacterium]